MDLKAFSEVGWSGLRVVLGVRDEPCEGFGEREGGEFFLELGMLGESLESLFWRAELRWEMVLAIAGRRGVWVGRVSVVWFGFWEANVLRLMFPVS